MSTTDRSLGTGAGPFSVLGGLSREAFASVATVVTWPSGVIDRGLAHAGEVLAGARDLPTAPVLLVHGFGANKSNWLFVQRCLRAAGVGHVHAVNCNPFRRDIPDLALTVRDRARALMARAGTDEIHLVGHSMGGLVARWTVQVAGLHEAVTCQTIASPHRGAPLARLGPGRAAAQMRPGSALLRRLETAAVPPSTRFVAYWSDVDAVVPAARARIEDPRLGAENVYVPGEGHLSIMWSRAVADAVTSVVVDHELRRAEREPHVTAPDPEHGDTEPEGVFLTAG